MHVLILGGNSDIGLAAAHIFAEKEGARITLASRGLEALEKSATDIALRYQVKAHALAFDAMDTASHKAFYEGLPEAPDVVVAAFGYLGKQENAEKDFAEAHKIISTNYNGAVSILEIAAADMERKGRGSILGIASVAGLRGRKSNYFYGSAKAGFIAYLSGLRHRLHHAGAHCATILPGFVATKMTEGMELPAALTAQPEELGQAVYKAWKQKKGVVYSKWMWRWIMLIIRLLPERIFKNTNL
jgi:short-subunit dehydrogenase